jgi:hypothetical protein
MGGRKGVVRLVGRKQPKTLLTSRTLGREPGAIQGIAGFWLRGRMQRSAAAANQALVVRGQGNGAYRASRANEVGRDRAHLRTMIDDDAKSGRLVKLQAVIGAQERYARRRQSVDACGMASGVDHQQPQQGASSSQRFKLGRAKRIDVTAPFGASRRRCRKCILSRKHRLRPARFGQRDRGPFRAAFNQAGHAGGDDDGLNCRPGRAPVRGIIIRSEARRLFGEQMELRGRVAPRAGGIRIGVGTWI